MLLLAWSQQVPHHRQGSQTHQCQRHILRHTHLTHTCILPHTHMWVPQMPDTTPSTNNPPIPGHRGEPGEPWEVVAGPLKVEHLQHMWASTTPNDGWSATVALSGPRCPAHCLSYTHPCPGTLAGWCEGGPWLWCPPWCHWASSSWHTSHVVPQDGHLPQEVRQAQTDSWPATTQLPRHSWDPPHAITLPLSRQSSSPHLQNCLWRMEWISQHCTTWGWLRSYHIHRTLRLLSLLCHPTGVHCLRQRLQPWLRGDHVWHPTEDQMRGWHPDVVWLHQWGVLSSSQVAQHLWQQWHHPEPHKVCLAQMIVEFAGFKVTPTSVRPCSHYLEAIQNFPTPCSITDMHRWFGLINQVSYAFTMTQCMLPFRKLVKPGTPFSWTNELDSIFEELKAIIISEIHKGVEIFNKTKPTCLATDWNKDGIGFWLFQKHCTCPSSKPFCCKTGWKVTLVGSRFTSGAESRYAPVKGEALAVVSALDKARHFVLGCSDLIVAVDHKPLLKVFGDQSLENIPNPHLHNLKEKSLCYHFRIIDIPSACHTAANRVSHHPVGRNTSLELPDDTTPILNDPHQPTPPGLLHDFLTASRTHDPDTIQVCSQSATPPTVVIKSVTWHDVRLATSSDPNMCTLIEMIQEGFSELPSDLPPRALPLPPVSWKFQSLMVYASTRTTS